MPSFYALEAVRAAKGRLPDFAELAREAETVTSARVGWPAPSDPATAIDDAEHDLAILEQLFSLPEAVAGSARYLLTTNSYLARALRTRYQRWNLRWTAADGLVSSSHTAQAILANHGLAARSYSPTVLQHYAACPTNFSFKLCIVLHHAKCPMQSMSSIPCNAVTHSRDTVGAV